MNKAVAMVKIAQFAKLKSLQFSLFVVLSYSYILECINIVLARIPLVNFFIELDK